MHLHLLLVPWPEALVVDGAGEPPCWVGHSGFAASAAVSISTKGTIR